MSDLRRLVRTIPNYPKPGILFRDVTTLMGDAKGLKAAIEGMTRGLARDLGPHNIRVNSIIPGAVRTPRQEALWHTPEEEARILAGQCLPQRVEVEDVAALALFLASDSARRCSGRDYYVDAGWYGA